VPAGAFGALCRRHGRVTDHLHAVEVVTVDATGEVRTVVATDDPADPHHDLWWAHAGGGGGTFGIATRFWFRSPDTDGHDPTRALPRPPDAVLTSTVDWPWEQLGEADFLRLIDNHGRLHLEHAAADSPYESLYSGLYLTQRMVGSVRLIAQLDDSLPGSAELMDAYVAALCAGLRCTPTQQRKVLPWLDAALRDLENRGPYTRCKGKGANLRQPYDADQAALLFESLSAASSDAHMVVVLFSYGGAVNERCPTDTAVAARDSVLRSYLGAYWTSAADDERLLERARDLYRRLYADTGGVPASSPRTDGTYIGYPDVDLVDGTPAHWPELYFGRNSARLQEIKARWDPRNVFRHALSITGAAYSPGRE
jgi:aclacinomycin oxidase